MRRLKAMALLAGLALCGSAQAAERLQVPQMPGWKAVANVADSSGDVTELIPDEEFPETWTRRLSIQAFRNVPMTVSGFLDEVVQVVAPVCDQPAMGGPTSLGKVSGLEAGSRAVACGQYKGDGKGHYALYFVIRGQDAFYVLSRTWRGESFASGANPISPRDLAEWTSLVDAVEVCSGAAVCR